MNAQTAHPNAHDVPRPTSTNEGNLGFVLRTTLAGIAALLVAMWLQIDTPRWAIWTVFIVSPPVRGNALRKTAARIFGTFIGCTVGVIAVALFPQDRVGFYVAFSLWLGACAFWATLRRGYVSYGASLAAFTSAIVSAGVSAQPLGAWQTAMDRGSATIIGILFALFASNLAATTDDVPGDLAKRICALAADLLDWAVLQLNPIHSSEPADAPLTARILALDESCSNAFTERPVLDRVKPLICGVPTALLSLQSAVLSTRRPHPPTELATRRATDALRGVCEFLRSGSVMDLPALQRQTASLTALGQSSSMQAPAIRQTLDALLYVLGSLQALLTFTPPAPATPRFPAPRFAANLHSAVINLVRAILATGAGFVIWDLTAWPQGPVFMVIIAVVVVVLVKIENPIPANWATVVGVAVGGLLGLLSKYLLLVRFNEPLNLVLVLFPLLFLGAWIETKGKLAPFGVFLVIAVLYMVEPTNTQMYNFSQDVNTLVALEVALVFTTLVFSTIGTPKKGPERIAELLTRMRRRQQSFRRTLTPGQCLGWETQMYDELQRLQDATKDAAHRRHGVNLILRGLELCQTSLPDSEAIASY